jgi:hypothetical protein
VSRDRTAYPCECVEVGEDDDMGLLTADLGSVPVAELVPVEVCEGVVSPLPGRPRVVRARRGHVGIQQGFESFTRNVGVLVKDASECETMTAEVFLEDVICPERISPSTLLTTR